MSLGTFQRGFWIQFLVIEFVRMPGRCMLLTLPIAFLWDSVWQALVSFPNK